MRAAAALAAAALLPAFAPAQTVRPEWVRAHELFLAADALAGRGSATRDEAVAAAYVAAQFAGFGLQPAPGAGGYLQTATVVNRRLDGAATLRSGGLALPSLTLLRAPAAEVRGSFAVTASADPAALPAADIVLATAAGARLGPLAAAAQAKHVRLLIVPETPELRRRVEAHPAAVPPALDGEPDQPAVAVALLAPGDAARLAARPREPVVLSLPPLVATRATTTNAIGYLPGTDPAAGLLLLTAHLDHLGTVGGVVMPGANDDASGVTAVLELARALSTGPRPRRGILFVCYGSEETGQFGSRYFALHPPVPLARIAANLEFEMIGAQDPKLPQGTLMMTGFDRSNFGAALRAHGALVTADPYPEQHFFERSDNYQLALAGVVAHTVSGWATVPTYHQPTDTIAHLDLPFMTRAIQSLVAPLRWLAEGGFEPRWNEGGRPRG